VIGSCPGTNPGQDPMDHSWFQSRRYIPAFGSVGPVLFG